MSVAKILEEQSAWLQQAAKTIGLDRPTEAEAGFPEEVRKRRAAQIKARIAALETQREDAAKRFNAAIAEAKQELQQLAAELDLRKAQANEGPTRREGKPAPTKRPKAAAPKATKHRPVRGEQ